jgi:hypothetical protein
VEIVEEAVEAIIRSGGSDLGGLGDDYRAQGLSPPIVRLAPRPDEVPLAAHRALLAWWSERAPPDGLPPAGLIAPDVLRAYLGRLIVLEPVAGGADFRYRLYGSIVARFVGTDLTGKLLSQTYAMGVWPDPVTRYYLATYRAALRARQPLYSFQKLSGATTLYVWHRLLLPFADAAGAVSRLLLFTVPCDPDGNPLPAWLTTRN